MRTRYCTNMMRYAFSTKSKISIEQFEGDEWTVNLYPFYPQILKKKTKNIYEISANSTVLAMSFISNTADEQTAWQNRRSITFKFKQFGLMLGAHIGAQKQVIIESQSSMSKIPRTKIIEFHDQPEKESMLIKLSSMIQKPRDPDDPRVKQVEWSLKTNMGYNDYRVMYKLLESSLYDLSGWRFMMEFQKKQQISKVESMIYEDNEFEQLLKNN